MEWTRRGKGVRHFKFKFLGETIELEIAKVGSKTSYAFWKCPKRFPDLRFELDAPDFKLIRKSLNMRLDRDFYKVMKALNKDVMHRRNLYPCRARRLRSRERSSMYVPVKRLTHKKPRWVR